MNPTATQTLDRDMLPAVQAAPDRLPPMLFLAALFHAIIILGVTFNPDLDFDSGPATTLDVVIIADPDQRIERPDKAEYLAQASQEGGGNTPEKARPSSTPQGLPVPAEMTELLGDVAPESIPEEYRESYIASSLAATEARLVRNDPRPPEEESRTEASSLPQGAEEALPLPDDRDDVSDIHDDDPRELVFSVDTQESELAGYLAAWKARVEEIGTDYYNREIDDLASHGSPTIEVAIGVDGDLEEIIVRRSSGDGRVDQAALDVLRRAAPYDPIPASLRRDFDALRFEYKFEFRQSQ